MKGDILNFSNLRKYISECVKEDIEIDSVFVAQVGCIALEVTEEISSRLLLNNSYSYQNSNCPPDLNIDIIKALKSHKNTFDVDFIKDVLLLPFSFRLSNSCILFEGKPYHLRVDIPSRFQKHILKIANLEEKTVEKFDVISNGSMFIAYCKIDNYPFFPHFGNEYRDLLKTQINNETDFKYKDFGPTPMHVDIYFALAKTKDNIINLKQDIYNIENNLVIVFYANHNLLTYRIYNFLSDITMNMNGFYKLMLQRSALFDCRIEMDKDFNVLSNSAQSLIETGWWRLIKSHYLVKNGKKRLANIHIQFSDLEMGILEYQMERDTYLKALRDDAILSKIYLYFEDQTNLDIQSPQSVFLSSLKYFQEELLTFSRIRTIIIASFGGAIIGAILYALFSGILN